MTNYSLTFFDNDDFVLFLLLYIYNVVTLDFYKHKDKWYY